MNLRIMFRNFLRLMKNNPLVVRYREHCDKQWQETVSRDEEFLSRQIDALENHVSEMVDFLEEDSYNLQALKEFRDSKTKFCADRVYVEKLRKDSDSIRDLVLISGTRYQNTAPKLFGKYLDIKKRFDENIFQIYERLEARF